MASSETWPLHRVPPLSAPVISLVAMCEFCGHRRLRSLRSVTSLFRAVIVVIPSIFCQRGVRISVLRLRVPASLNPARVDLGTNFAMVGHKAPQATLIVRVLTIMEPCTTCSRWAWAAWAWPYDLGAWGTGTLRHGGCGERGKVVRGAEGARWDRGALKLNGASPSSQEARQRSRPGPWAWARQRRPMVGPVPGAGVPSGPAGVLAGPGPASPARLATRRRGRRALAPRYLGGTAPPLPIRAPHLSTLRHGALRISLVSEEKTAPPSSSRLSRWLRLASRRPHRRPACGSCPRARLTLGYD